MTHNRMGSKRKDRNGRPWLAVLAGGLVGLALLPATGLGLDVLMDENFEGYAAVPAVLDGLSPDDGNEAEWIWTGEGATANVIQGSSTDGSGANQRILRLQATTTPEFVRVRFHRSFAAPVSPQTGVRIVHASFKLKLDDDAWGNDLVFGLMHGDGSAAPNRLTIAHISGNNTLRYRSCLSPGVYGNYVQVTPGFTFNLTDWYRIDITADLELQKWSLSVVNLNDPSNSASAEDIWFALDEQEVAGFYVSNRSGSYGYFDGSMDDLRITGDPGPGSLILLGAR